MPPTRLSVYQDEELMLLVGQGEVAAFDELYYRYGKRLMVYFTRMLNFDKALAEDALQDLFLKIAESPAKFDHRRPFKTWIYSVASNTCKNYYRHQAVIKRSQDELGGESETEADHLPEQLLAKIDRKKLNETLDLVLLSLPPEKKEAFILRYQEEKSIAEIAQIQECPEGSVKSRLHYTLKILEVKLKQFNPVA